MTSEIYQLGTVEASEELIEDLYISLRRKLANWSRVTRQTPQARMGYVGQHLTSVVTGIPGGRSGARGHDLFDAANNRFSEIKTCTRVDQLGQCTSCGTQVSSIEESCPSCQSFEINRKDDSKWLIGIRHEAELKALFDPFRYYFVLFDFVDLKNPTDIACRIWEVDPRCRGFSFCMVDYWFNIRTVSVSKAPFNLWPFSLKFALMEPLLIYRAVLNDSGVQTQIFPGRDAAVAYALPDLTEFSRATGLAGESIVELALKRKLEVTGSKAQILDRLQRARIDQNWTDSELIYQLVDAVYRDRVVTHQEWLPESVRFS